MAHVGPGALTGGRAVLAGFRGPSLAGQVRAPAPTCSLLT